MGLPLHPGTTSRPLPEVRRWDIFCRVVDNFGDAGVCWRLARSLHEDHGQAVRLWLDDLSVLAQLCPGYSASGVDVRGWTAPLPAGADPVADVVIEAFACELPEDYLGRMARQPSPPCWINLEYLSAEPWVEGCHGLASPHPRWPLRKFFFFPGFTDKTGGLPWGKAPQPVPDHSMARQPDGGGDGLRVSLFCYDHLPVEGLLSAWQGGTRPVLCRVPPGKPRKAVEQWLGRPLQVFVTIGSLTLIPIPFLPQADYDRLLVSCDLNFVRGEDSFMRAQWAGKPFLWQIYPQPDGVHEEKLEAFLKCYGVSPENGVAASLRELHALWNGVAGKGKWPEAWERFLHHLPALQAHARDWARQYQLQADRGGDLAGRLVKFVGKNSCLSV